MKRLPIVLAALLFPIITSVWAAPPFPQKSAERDDHKTQGNVAAAVATLQAQVAALQTQVAALQANSALTLNRVVNVGYDANGYKTVLFTGVNVQIVNGIGTTSGVPGDPVPRQSVTNGLGNLIVGYNEPRMSGPFICSDSSYDYKTACESAGGVWAISHKSGSHNLIVGEENSYSQHGGVVFGWRNASIRHHATITGGYDNQVRGGFSSISGGWANIASGLLASVSGGTGNIASGPLASVSGGYYNIASGPDTSVSGGTGNIATGSSASVTGGFSNTASGYYSSISGGSYNTTSGVSGSSSISGGRGCTETRSGGWAVGLASSVANGCANSN